MRVDRSSIPLLGPNADVLEELLAFPAETLRGAAESRGLDVDPNASAEELAHRLLRDRVRRSVEDLYAEQDHSFLVVDEYYPFLVDLIARLEPTHVYEIGCGTGLLTELLRDVLPPGGRFFGIDHAASGVARARARLAGDDRFAFEVGDAGELSHIKVPPGTDCALIPWVINWLDTHSVDRLYEHLAAQLGAAPLVSCVAFRACVARREGVEPDNERELRAAEAYLRGEPAEAEAIWDVRRYECYVRSLTDRFAIREEHVRPGGHIFWVGTAR